MKDEGRAAVYNAESQFRSLLDTPGVLIEIAGSRVVIPDEKKFGRVEDVQRYVDAVLKFLGSNDLVKVRERKGHTMATYHRAMQTIAVPDNVWALRESVVLHELAHHVAATGTHDKKFRSTFTDLVERVMGPEARFLLQHEYFTRGLTG